MFRSTKKENLESTLDKNGISSHLIKEIKLKIVKWQENITEIDLSCKNIDSFDRDICFPEKLLSLNLAHNKLVSIPSSVSSLKHLKILNISFNSIIYFDEVPSFCKTLKVLNLSNNNLKALPIWIWSQSSNNLEKLNLSNNVNISNCLKNGYLEKVLPYHTVITELKIYNCRLKNHLQLFSTFPKVKVIELGSVDSNRIDSNLLSELPCKGLDKCFDMEQLIINNTQLYTVNVNINMYKNMKELNLSFNNIHSLPNEFCQLDNLETCILSHNNLLYLPDEMFTLKKLRKLCLDSNILCMIFNNIDQLSHLEVLDLYDNNLYDIPNVIKTMQEIDLAQNYFQEPNDTAYIQKKSKLRLSKYGRLDGRKIEVLQTESEYSPDISDHEDLQSSCASNDKDISHRTLSSPEDWDSDEYWVPHHCDYNLQTPRSNWLYFVKKKMEEGNFCPMDLHTVSIGEKVKYENICNPPVYYESDGQFDDYSEDDS